MQVPPPDLGDHTLFGRLGLWLVGVLSAILWAVYRYMDKRGDKVEMELTELHKELVTKASVSALLLTDNEVRALATAIVELRIDRAAMHTELMTRVSLNREEMKTMLSLTREELKDALNKQTTEIRVLQSAQTTELRDAIRGAITPPP